MTLATISFQNYFRLYDKLSGMTGTAATEAEEFHTIYELDVVTIPTNKPSQRTDLPDRIYKTEAGKFKAIVNEVKERIDKGQPVLLGTVSVEKNEILSRLLAKAGIDHETLNAKNNEREAAIITKAGQRGAVTLATNIAGRGTDIVLGAGIADIGGLHVIGSERHEARRIDNQLRGRTARQGDPGSTQFYVSVEDDLMRIFGGERMKSLMEFLKVPEDVPIENKTVSKTLESAQKKVESHNFDIRKNLVSYDDVMNRHRKAIYAQRREILTRESIYEDIANLIKTECDAIASALVTANHTDLVEESVNLFALDNKNRQVLEKTPTGQFANALEKAALGIYKQREKNFGAEIIRRLEREVYLQVMDELWMQHLESMQHLREGIGWRSVGQRDPLVEYRREGQILFENLQTDLGKTTLRILFHAVPQPLAVTEESEVEVDTALTRAAKNSSEATGQLLDRQARRAKVKSDRKAEASSDTTHRERPKSKRKKQGKKKKRK